MTQPGRFNLSTEQLLDAYRTMKTIREFEERIHIENTTGDIAGFLHLSVGQEAVAAGVMAHLSSNDYIASTHRGHGHCIAKGSDVKAMMKEIYGRKGGLCGGKGGSMHIADLEKGMLGANGIVGGGGPLCVGAALSIKRRGERGVAVHAIRLAGETAPGLDALAAGTGGVPLHLAAPEDLEALASISTRVTMLRTARFSSSTSSSTSPSSPSRPTGSFSLPAGTSAASKPSSRAFSKAFSMPSRFSRTSRMASKYWVCTALFSAFSASSNRASSTLPSILRSAPVRCLCIRSRQPRSSWFWRESPLWRP